MAEIGDASGLRSSAAMPVSAVLNDLLKEITSGDGPPQALKTGISALDAAIGGLAPGHTIVVAEGGDMCRSMMFAGLIVDATIRQSAHTLLVSPTRGRNALKRVLSAMSGVPFTRVAKGTHTEDDIRRLETAGKGLARAPLTILDDMPITLNAIRRATWPLHSRNGLGLIIVDCVQWIGGHDICDDREGAVREISGQLRDLAHTLQVPIVVGAPLEYWDGRPRLRDLGKSEPIGQDADIVLLLHRAAEWPEKVNIIIEKHRNGPNGIIAAMARKDDALLASIPTNGKESGTT